MVAAQLVEQLATQGAELVVEELDDVEVVEDVDRVRQVVPHGPDVSRGHVGGDGGDPGPRPPQAFPEGFQGLHALAVADEHHGAGQQVEDHGEVMTPLADGDFVDGDLLELVQLGLAEAALQTAGLDVLDGVPTDLEVLGHVEDGHVARQLQDVALEGAGVVLFGVGEADLGLADRAAVQAAQPGHGEAQQHGLAADGRQAEGAVHAAVGPDVGRAALGAAPALAGLFDVEDHLTLAELLANIAVADEAEAVIQ